MNPWLDALRALPWILGLTLLLATASDAWHLHRPRRGRRPQRVRGIHTPTSGGADATASGQSREQGVADSPAPGPNREHDIGGSPTPGFTRERGVAPSPASDHALAVDLGLALFTLGLLISADPWWERAIWAAFLAFYAGSLVWRSRRASTTSPRRSGPACPPAAVCPSPCTRGEGTGEGGRAIARWAEPAIVALAAPFLWFPTQYPPLTITALALVAILWLATSLLRRRFWPAAPWNLALALFLFMAAVGTACSAVWELTLPKVTGLILGLAIYRALAEFCRDRRSLLLALAGLLVLALGFSAMGLLFGELRADKIPFVAALRVHIPQLDEALPGTQGGRVSTNQLGGTLLYVLPLLIGPLLVERRSAAVPRREWRLWLGLSALGALILSAALLLTQSRGAWVGMAAGLACLVGLRWRWGRWALLAGAIALGLGVWRFWPEIAAQLARNPATVGLASPGTLIWRVEVWERSIGYLGDVPFTGYGLGTFRAVDTLFYGPGIIGSGGENAIFDVGVPHAHNVFLQMGFDVGIPGLLAYLAILLLAARECWLLARRAPGLYGALGMGALAALVACHVYGLVDVVALGAKPGVLWWGLLAFIAAITHHGGTENTEE